MKPILACMLSVSGLTLTEDEKKLLSKANPLGITLFKRNILDEMKQVVATCSELTDVAYERFSKIKQLGTEKKSLTNVISKIDSTTRQIKDLKDRPLLLFINEWSIGMVLDRNKGLELNDFAK